MVLGHWDQKPFGEMTMLFKASLTPSSSLLLKIACAAQHHTTQSEQEVTIQNNPKEIKDASYSEELCTAQHLALQSSTSSFVSPARRGAAILAGTVCTSKLHDIRLL